MSHISKFDRLSVLYGNEIDFSKKYRIFLEAREFARFLKLRGSKGWYEYCKSNKKPVDIPACPSRTYKDDGWVGFEDWLGKKPYKPFVEAREFARSLKLRGSKGWYEYCKSNKKPVDIPFSPHMVYKNKGWVNWGDWLDKTPCRSFLEAREFARSLKLGGSEDWRKYCTSGKKPVDIPACPSRTYKDDGWVGFEDWLGKKPYKPFVEAREFARSLKLGELKEWKEYCKSEKKPDDIPSCPNTFYKNNGWVGVGDWLGTGFVAFSKRKYRPFAEARKFVRSLKFKNTSEWEQYCKSEKKPADIPATPNQVYKEQGWIGYDDWLGKMSYRPFLEAREFVRFLKLCNVEDWYKYCTSGKKPVDIPSCPNNVYKGGGWVGYGDWLGTGFVAFFKRRYRSFTKSRKFVRLLKIKNFSEWEQYCKSGKKPADIPSNPDRTYQNKGWISYGDWFGNGNVAPFKRKYRSFSDARKFVRFLQLTGSKKWYKYCTSGKKPVDIPSCPDNVYKGGGWVGYGDWLGK